MGVPALFRWLSQKYPKIISPVIEEQPREVDGVQIPVDTTSPNPNGEEFDNLYLDMNGIVHPCSHPEDKPAPETEEEMMLEIFKYTDRVVKMVRPRKLLMLAVDGVAPRAKMNQQRSRRFRAAQEAKQKDEDNAALAQLLKQQNGNDAAHEILSKKTWDSNSITPGTPFMEILARSLRYWIAYKLNTDPAWENLKVIISDATVPGEGEHKIMEFVRSQRRQPEHDPNTRHVIYGLDADLIMLGLATHEPHFRVLREDVFFQDSKNKRCRICNQTGHFAENCTGQAKVKEGEFDEKGKGTILKPFIWLHVNVLREYLEAEMYVPNAPFEFDLERALDDWVFMCFFVGNDFLPHLPSLDIREEGIDTLIAIWRDNIPLMGGYVTKDGEVNMERVQYILAGLAKQEDAIFKRRREIDERKEANAKRRKLEGERRFARFSNGGENTPGTDTPTQQPRGRKPRFEDPGAAGLPVFGVADDARDIKHMTHEAFVNRQSAVAKANAANKSAAAVLKEQLLGRKTAEQTDGDANGEAASTPAKDATPGDIETPPSALGKRKAELLDDDSGTPGRNTPQSPATPAANTDEPPPDTVRLWESGYADRYYEQKFKVDSQDIEFRHQVGRDYVEGLCWVLLYYFQGCPSWTWYYPHHYAPFAADFVDLAKMQVKFDKGIPFKPYEQLMGVLPAASNHAIPEVFRSLMSDEDSDIIDFYPENFPIDLNGKKFAWQGVALLPFIDAKRLLSAMNTKYPLLTEEEHARNEVGKDVLLFSTKHPLYEEVAFNWYSKKQGDPKHKLNPTLSHGLMGEIEKNEDYLPQSSLSFPLPNNGMPDLDEDMSISVHYEMPCSTHMHKSMLLRGLKLPNPVLDQGDLTAVRTQASRSGRSFGRAPLRQQRGNGGYDRSSNGYRNNNSGGYSNGPPINYAAGPPVRYNPGLMPGVPPPPPHMLPPGYIPPPPPGFSGMPPPPPGLPWGQGQGQGRNSGYGGHNAGYQGQGQMGRGHQGAYQQGHGSGGGNRDSYRGPGRRDSYGRDSSRGSGRGGGYGRY